MTIHEMINTIYSRWCNAIKDKVIGYSMENSATVTKLPYATMYFTGIPGSDWDLKGDEAAVTPTAQIDIYTKGQRALTQAYEIDDLSHACLTSMGFRRSMGPELIQSTDPSIKRLTSRYTRIVGYGDSLEI